jgi:hypothetical protein
MQSPLVNRRAAIAALFCIAPIILDSSLAAESGHGVLIELPENFSLEVRYKDRSVKLTAEDIINGLQSVPSKTIVGRTPSRSATFPDFVPKAIAP